MALQATSVKTFFAAVKYKNGEREIISTDSIRLRKEGTTELLGPYQPKDVNDFVEGRFLYGAKTSQSSADTRPHFYFVMIGRLACKYKIFIGTCCRWLSYP